MIEFLFYPPVYIQQDCKATRQFVHNPKTKSDANTELLPFVDIREDILDGMYDTFKTRGGDGGDMACDGQTKATAGRDFKYNLGVGSGQMRMRPFDRLHTSIQVTRCKKCDSRWLEHALDPVKKCMTGKCRTCGTITWS